MALSSNAGANPVPATPRHRVRGWAVGRAGSALDVDRWWPAVIFVVSASQRAYRRFARASNDPADATAAVRAFISFGPQSRVGLGQVVHLRLGDPRRGCALWECRVEPEQTSRAAPVCGRVRLLFPAGRVPKTSGPLPVWQDGIIGQVWGMRPL